MLMAIFDKSFIHSISAEEAAVFDMHFLSNITPLFFVEVLADLEKAGVDDAAKREAIVRSLSRKTPAWRSYPNVPHEQLIAAELGMGKTIELGRRPHVGGGRRVRTEEGLGTVFEEPPEMKATSRWGAGEFGPDEYLAARAWREGLAAAPQGDFLLGGSASRFSFKDLEAVKRHVDVALDRDGSRYATLRSALAALNVPLGARPGIVARWKALGGPKFSDFAPYSAHVLKVDLFRVLAMASDLMSASKISNYADMAYLYYLPFCQAFISTDKLHRKVVPLFLRPGQVFVWGPDLRPHLAQLVASYLADPEIESAGLIKVSGKTKFPAGTFIGDLFRSVHSNYSDDGEDVASKLSPEQEKALVERLSRISDAPSAEGQEFSQEEDTTVTFTRHVARRRGRFAVMPAGAEGSD